MSMSITRAKLSLGSGLAILSVALLWGCARAPEGAINEATSAFEAAKKVEAEAYAPDAYVSAEEAYSNAMAEVEQQNQKIALLRSYERASRLLSNAKKAATLAQTRGEARREEMKRYSDGLIQDARSAVVSARQAVGQLGRGKKSDLNATLETADQVLAAAERAWQERKYLAARDEAEDARVKADEVRENALSAIRRG